MTRKGVLTLVCLLCLGQSWPRAQAQRVSHPQLDVTTSVERGVAAPGARVLLVTEVVPKQGVHVYAPGTHAYQVIRLRLEPNTLVRVGRTRYPMPEDYYFPPLKEHVPTYQDPFRLTTEITFNASAGARQRLAGLATVTLRGTLDFQACNDRLCFTPVSMPVTFVVARPSTNGASRPVRPRTP